MKMDVQNKDFYKSLEVIWNRNKNTCKPKLLPEIKRINIDDSVKKIGKVSKLDKFGRTIKMNENCLGFAHKRVKKRLFQEYKSEKESKYLSTKKLNKKHCETLSCNLSESPQIILERSPLIISNREKFKKKKKKKSKQCLFHTKITKTIESLPQHSEKDTSFIKSPCIVNQILPSDVNLLNNKSPEIISNRKRQYIEDTSVEKINLNESTLTDSDQLNKKYCETYPHSLTELFQNSLAKSPPIVSYQEKLKKKKFKQSLFQTESSKNAEYSSLHSVNDTSIIKTSCIIKEIFPNTSNLMPHKSPEIMSNRKQQNIKDTFLEKIILNESTLNHSDNLNEKQFGTHSHNLFGTSLNSLTKSPLILSKQEKLKKNESKQYLFLTESSKTAKYSPPHLVKDASFIKSPCIVNQILPSDVNLLNNKSPEIISNRKRQYIEETSVEKINLNESTLTDSDKLNKNYCETFHTLSEIPLKSLTISPPIVSNREKLQRNKLKQCLFQTESQTPVQYLPSHSVDDVSITKSPEIISNRKQQYIEDTFLEKKNSSESTYSDFNKLKKKHYDSKLYNSFEISKHALTKSLKSDFTPLHSVDNISIIKSPEVISNRKRQIKLLEKMKFDTPNKNYINCISQESKLLNEKCNHMNTHQSKVKLKLNFEDSEDIIESSEVINLVSKKKCKENKNNRCKTKKIKNNIHGSFTHELESVVDEKNEISVKNSFVVEKTINNKLSDDINDSLDVVNTENILMPVKIKVKKNCHKRKPKKFIDTFCVEKNTFKPQKSNENKDKCISSTHLPLEISLIPATPEKNATIIGKPAIECSPETILNSYIPQIEVDKSPKTPLNNNCQVMIQSIFTPPNADSLKLPILFDPVVSPTQSFINSELSFKIDSVESPNTVHECDHFFSPEITKKKLDKNVTPNYFDSAKKRKKLCKDGLKGKFRELINRKKSEACIREYEKNLSSKYQSKHGITTLLNVIEVWKEFRTFILFCHYIKSETKVQKVIVTLDNCPKNVTKNSVIRIYSPWLTIESKIAEVILFVGVIYAEVIEFSGPIKPLAPIELFPNISGLPTTLFQSEVKWQCNCSEDTACQCLGESSVYKYLQYMISH